MNKYKISAVIRSLVFIDIKAETKEEAIEQFADKVQEVINKNAYSDWIIVDEDSLVAEITR